jgi:hypothetical protein
MAKLSKEKISRIENYEDRINDIRCEMIKEIIGISSFFTEEVLENLSTDELCTLCISYL